jgi:hypothetical protein
MTRYRWKVTIEQERTTVVANVTWLPPFKQSKPTTRIVHVVRNFPRTYRTPQAAEQARLARFAKAKSWKQQWNYPPEATWELEIVQTCPNQFDPLLLTTLHSRMESLRAARSSPS